MALFRVRVFTDFVAEADSPAEAERMYEEACDPDAGGWPKWDVQSEGIDIVEVDPKGAEVS